MPERPTFRGSIAGLGTTSGVRVVVGLWQESPFGAFAEVMLAEPDGTRRLLAPTREVAAFVSDAYLFDDVQVVRFSTRRDWSFLRVTAGELDLRYLVGRRTPLGMALRGVPRRLDTAGWWGRVADPAARSLPRGARGRGAIRNGRTEVYAASDHRAITRAMGSWAGVELGSLAPLSPDPAFGFASFPRRPCVTTLEMTVVWGSP